MMLVRWWYLGELRSESDDGEKRISFGSGKNRRRRRHSAAEPKRERERERERETEKERNPNLLFYLFRLCLTAIGPGSQKLNGLSKKEYPTVMIEL